MLLWTFLTMYIYMYKYSPLGSMPVSTIPIIVHILLNVSVSLLSCCIVLCACAYWFALMASVVISCFMVQIVYIYIYILCAWCTSFT